MNIGLFYGSSTCYTEMAAEKIRDIIGPELVTLHNLKDDAVALMEQYDVLILGIPTWDFGEIQEDWEAIWDQLDSVNFEGTSQKPIIADGQLFVGLALDETNQYDLSDERLQNWCEQILGEMAEQFS